MYLLHSYSDLFWHCWLVVIWLRITRRNTFPPLSNMDNVISFDHLQSSVLVFIFQSKKVYGFLFFSAILSIIYYYVDYKIKHRRLEKMIDQFDGPKGLPIIGNAHEFLGSPKVVLKNGIALANTYKNPRVWLVHKPYIIISTPEDYQTVAFKTLEKDNSYKFVADMLGDGLITSEVNRWKRNRRIINPALNPTMLYHNFLQIFNEKCVTLINQLKKEVGTKKQFDLWPYISENSIMTICETTMGYTDADDSAEVMKYGEDLIKSSKLVSLRIYKPWLMPSITFKAYRYLLGFGKIFDTVRELPLKVVKKRREQFEKMKTEGYVRTGQEKTMQNFIDILLNYHDANTNFTDKELTDEGSETTAVTICFCMLMLGMRQDVQKRVYEEIHSVFGDENRLPNLEDLSKLSYLEQCIKETLRRFTVVPLGLRHTQEDIPISDGKIIPSGCNIALFGLAIHLNPEIYPNPEIWDPSNFDPDKVANRHKASFVPFGAGPRGCVGQKYAMVSMKAQLSTMIRNFKITTDIKMEDIELSIDILLRSSTGYYVKLDYRHGESLTSSLF
ncbi:cytochrome P450 4C1-like isoform X2 [Planococcus citri]|uniref:cytochrome P450 4C1-like isoform X2 n=1 Tax=Planococcus citri TaxID=170843 RepID=UPI0031F98906